MSNVTNTHRASETETVVANPPSTETVSAGGPVNMPSTGETSVEKAARGAPPDDEVVAATVSPPEEADRTVADLTAAGIPRENIVVLADREEKRNFMKRYVHRDGDRHTHAGVASAFFALAGACVFGLFGVLVAQRYTTDTTWLIVAILVGGLAGAALGAILGGFAMRTADDSSIEIVETVAAQGTLVSVCSRAGDGISLEEAGRIIARHNGRVMRLRHQVTQADLHPGDTRPSYLWSPANVERPVQPPR